LRRDSDFREKKHKKIFESKEVSPENSYIAIASNVSGEIIDNWFKQGGAVCANETFLRDFVTVELIVHSIHHKAFMVESERSGFLEKFIKTNKSDLNQINPSRLLKMAEKLLDINLPFLAIDVISHLVCQEEPWLSPSC